MITENKRDEWTGRCQMVRISALMVTLIMIMTSTGSLAADDDDSGAPGIRYLEAGASYTHFTNDLEDGTGEGPCHFM